MYRYNEIYNTYLQLKGTDAVKPWKPTDEEKEIIRNQTNVSLMLTKQVISKNAREKNLVFSPLSIQILLGLAASGANPETRDELLGFLKFESVEKLDSFFTRVLFDVFSDGQPLGGPCLSSANGVWVDQRHKLKPDFKEKVENTYKAASFLADFCKAEETIKEVNQWAEKETRGLIKKILRPDSVDEYTNLILANALYFKAEWLDRFDRRFTRDYKFFLLNGSSVEVPFMPGGGDAEDISIFDGFKVMRLRYKQGHHKHGFSMCFFLPDAIDGLPSLVERICSEHGFLETHLRPQKRDKPVRVRRQSIPKFKISFDFRAKEILKGLELVLPFSGDALSETVQVPDGVPVYITEIHHKASIKVNEEGTEAAAMTVMEICPGSPEYVEMDEIEFVADHPFLFVIKEDTTNLVLFIGQVVNPLLVD